MKNLKSCTVLQRFQAFIINLIDLFLECEDRNSNTTLMALLPIIVQKTGLL